MAKKKSSKKVTTVKKKPARSWTSGKGVTQDTDKKQESKIRPLGNRALIRPFSKEDLEPKTSFGIILPDSDKKEKAEQGVVLAVGPGDFREGKFIPITVKVGDVVSFSKYGYDDITVDGEELYLIKEDNILAVIKI